MRALLDLRVRDVLRNAAAYTFVSLVFWLPLIVALGRAQP